MRDATDVLIIGGGVVGTSAAYFLRRAGKSVTLLERGSIGGQASGVNFGNVRRQGRYLPQLPLAHRSRHLWGKLGAMIGDDCEFAVSGHLRVAFTAQEAETLERYAGQARDWDLRLEVIGGNALHQRFPYLGPSAIAASLSPDDGHANPRLVAPAFARAAAALGANVYENTKAADITFGGGKFLVSSGTKDYHAEVLLNAAGAWGSQIAARFDESVPVLAQGPQMAVTEPFPPLLGQVLGTVDGSAFLRQVSRGNVVISGGPHGPASLESERAQSVPETAISLFASCLKLVPDLKTAQVIRCWSGVEGFTPDHLPVIGASTTYPGLFHAFAFCGHGFQLGPGVGAVLAELISTGHSETLVAPFGIGRLLHDDRAVER